MLNTKLTCGVKGCSNPAYTKINSNYCLGHHRLRAWLRRGGDFESFVVLHERGNKNHGKPVCKVSGCEHRQKVNKGKPVGYCSLHFNNIIDGTKFSKHTHILTDYSLEISLDDWFSRARTKDSKRETCKVDGCNNLQNKLYHSKVKKYSLYCDRHKKTRVVCAIANKMNMAKTSNSTVTNMNLKVCSICGWDGPCDKHRIRPGKDGGAYTKANILVVCPNCHRLLHRGIDPKIHTMKQKSKTG